MSKIQQTNRIKSYSELCSLETFEDRFNYLKLHGHVGLDTFGYDRYMNQDFYRSTEWKQVRSYIIARDSGCDLGIPDNQIFGSIYIHHINPITPDDITSGTDKLLDPENLICVSLETHNALHYGDNSIVNKNKVIERVPNDTCPWKKVR